MRILPKVPFKLNIAQKASNTRKLFVDYLAFLFFYLKKKVLGSSYLFEKNKNRVVKLFIMKRGRYNRPFLHLTAMGVMCVGVLIAPFLADTYPLLSSNSKNVLKTVAAETKDQSIVVGENVFSTNISDKPRSEVLMYRVEKGDTVSSIAQKFRISADTIKWANDMTTDSITVGDELKIPPVTGIVHKVAKGDTVYTIAKKYDTNAQQIVDFPFNDFANPETFSLVEGQLLVVPDGVKPQEKPTIRRQTYIVQGPVGVSDTGFSWPVRGEVSQFASWYHMALDITADVGTPVIAGETGKVSLATSGGWNGGYGTHIIVDNGTGFETLYAHMSGLNVSAGDTVVAGKTIVGWVGLTGRTTGPHLHFEIRKGGALVNPLSYLQ